MIQRRQLKQSAPLISALCSLMLVALATSLAVGQTPDSSVTAVPETKSAAPAVAGATDVDKQPADASTATAPNLPIAAKIDGTPIYQSEVEQALAAAHLQKIDPANLPNIQASALEQIISKKLMDMFLAQQKATASKAEVDASLDRLKATLKEQHNDYAGFLARMQTTEAGLRDTIARELSWRKYASVSDTDDNLRGLFKQLHEQFDGTQRRVSHILLRPEGAADVATLTALRDRAVKLRDDISAGHITFEAAAEKYSAGPSRHRSGDLGYIPPQGVMAPEFSQMAFMIQPGEISQPVVTMFGIHLIKVTDVKPGSKTFGEVRDAVKAVFPDFLMRQVTAQLRQHFADKIEYSDSFPHFKPGTSELATPAPAAGNP